MCSRRDSSTGLAGGLLLGMGLWILRRKISPKRSRAGFESGGPVGFEFQPMVSRSPDRFSTFPQERFKMDYIKPEKPSLYFPAFVEAIPDLSGKTFVITGTTSGTGRVASASLRKRGRILMLNRPSERSKAAQSFMDATYPDGDIQTVECDLLSFASVRRAAAAVAERCSESGIFALVNNAGIMAMPDEATEDGFDTQMQANHLSHFLLTAELFSALQRGAEKHGESRIVNHSSVARKGVRRLEGNTWKGTGNLGATEPICFCWGALGSLQSDQAG